MKGQRDGSPNSAEVMKGQRDGSPNSAAYCSCKVPIGGKSPLKLLESGATIGCACRFL